VSSVSSIDGNGPPIGTDGIRGLTIDGDCISYGPHFAPSHVINVGVGVGIGDPVGNVVDEGFCRISDPIGIVVGLRGDGIRLDNGSGVICGSVGVGVIGVIVGNIGNIGFGAGVGATPYEYSVDRGDGICGNGFISGNVGASIRDRGDGIRDNGFISGNVGAVVMVDRDRGDSIRDNGFISGNVGIGCDNGFISGNVGIGCDNGITSGNAGISWGITGVNRGSTGNGGNSGSFFIVKFRGDNGVRLGVADGDFNRGNSILVSGGIFGVISERGIADNGNIVDGICGCIVVID
jgi:hypothetical protein